MKYTGFKDGTGKKIYEDDILRTSIWQQDEYRVYFNDEEGEWYVIQIENFVSKYWGDDVALHEFHACFLDWIVHN